uniref:NADH dehydrogenase subunit 4L n=1 Tax=Archiblatta hoeveni TaxID=406597 RepID=UPI0022FD8631|nr:NADH dehydrogenase subunit 4L [Archiblatta hoeveni]WAX39255.1 NADH dehydrogenase subunit 4L [Archiblatta hoeveni]
MMIIFFYIMFFCGVWVFTSNHKHLLVTLLSLEFIVLVVFLMLYYYLSGYNNELFFSMIFLTFSVCEGALGLSILVSMIRSYGNDYFQSYIMLQC